MGNKVLILMRIAWRPGNCALFFVRIFFKTLEGFGRGAKQKKENYCRGTVFYAVIRSTPTEVFSLWWSITGGSIISHLLSGVFISLISFMGAADSVAVRPQPRSLCSPLCFLLRRKIEKEKAELQYQRPAGQASALTSTRDSILGGNGSLFSSPIAMHYSSWGPGPSFFTLSNVTA